MLKVKRANPKNESPATPAADAVTASAVRSATDVLPDEQKEDARPTWQYVLRLIGSSLLLFAIIANMVMIFLFSAESISESSDRSTGVIMKLAAILYRDYDELNWLEKEQLYSAMATPVRKLAHMAEYASLGFLTGAFLLPTRKKKRWIPWVIPAAFCLIDGPDAQPFWYSLAVGTIGGLSVSFLWIFSFLPIVMNRLRGEKGGIKSVKGEE